MAPNPTAEWIVDQVVRETFARPVALNTAIHPDDQMLSFAAGVRGSEEIALADYFRSGGALLNAVRQLVTWKFGSFDHVAALLDFAGGYGRLTRFLVHELPPDRIWIAEIQPEAVAFQEAQFGVHGILSATNPADLACDRRFDCIFVASLFTHLPEATFTAWLSKLYSLLNPGGLLIFSVHDAALLMPGEVMPESGLYFREASEIASLDTREYGMSIVTEAFVRAAVQQATGRPVYQRIPYGLQYHQDLYLLANEPQPDFSTLHYRYGPYGFVDAGKWVSRDQLWLRGWAIDATPGAAVQEIQVMVDGRLGQKCLPFTERPDVDAQFPGAGASHAGWACSCYVPEATPQSRLEVKVVSTQGEEHLIYIGTIGALARGEREPESSPAAPESTLAQQQALVALQQDLADLRYHMDAKNRYIAELETVLDQKNRHIGKLERLVQRQERALRGLPVRVGLRVQRALAGRLGRCGQP
jgi:SAM-dependent methyltransferase